MRLQRNAGCGLRDVQSWGVHEPWSHPLWQNARDTAMALATGIGAWQEVIMKFLNRVAQSSVMLPQESFLTGSTTCEKL